MSYLDRIASCNTHDLTQYVPFCIDGERYGWVLRSSINLLEKWPDVFTCEATSVSIHPGLTDVNQRTQAVDKVVRWLIDQGILSTYLD